MKKIICLLFGHKYLLAQRLTDWSRRVRCSRCNRSFAMNDDNQLIVDWSPDFHRLYESHGIKIKYTQKEFNKIKDPEPYAYDAIGYIDGVIKARSLHYTKEEAEKFIKFLVDHGYKEVKIIPLSD